MKRIITIVLYLLPVISLFAQETEADKKLLTRHIQNEQYERATQKKYRPAIQVSYNPVKILLFTPLFLYQKFISEQISAICEFEPSCSGFAVQSIKQLGIVKGLFMAADRLTRCNGEAQPETQFYLIDHHSGKVIDEPGMYKIKD
ncbi:MAG TPA: membrane protein insertion efficiency factor YidD [Bacteroidia bacterium]|jgi:putative component of membrane protein insertase Oxa1/YidC/SpoIIIJ protein YidD|nr:membrane protein insertion efficiency factor YidD [Bacteroidia bacterium]